MQIFQNISGTLVTWRSLIIAWVRNKPSQDSPFHAKTAPFMPRPPLSCQDSPFHAKTAPFMPRPPHARPNIKMTSTAPSNFEVTISTTPLTLQEMTSLGYQQLEPKTIYVSIISPSFTESHCVSPSFTERQSISSHDWKRGKAIDASRLAKP